MKYYINYVVQNKVRCVSVALLLLVVLGILDWKTGYELSFQFFYFIPLATVAYNTEFKNQFLLFFSTVTAIVWLIADYSANHAYSADFLYFWNTMSRFIIFSSFSLFLSTMLKNKKTAQNLNISLTQTNNTLTQSILYAKTIQDAITVSFEQFKQLFPCSFIYNKPQNILSGDFFWYHKGQRYIFMVAADCTGHGVPGALLSIVGNVLLHRIVVENGLNSPDVILKNLHQELIRIFSSGENATYDGMEICLLRYDITKAELTLSQTTESIVLVTPNKEIIQFATHGYTLGSFLSNKNKGNYTAETIKIEKGTQIYLFSDGYADQFNGKTNERFGTENLLKLIQKSQSISPEKRQELFFTEMEKWQSGAKQVDDMLVVGIQINSHLSTEKGVC